MRLLILCLLPYMSIFLESTFFARYPVLGVGPDLVLVFVAFYAIIYGSGKGAGYGFLCGLFKDLYLGRFIGLNAVSLTLTALLLGWWEVKLFKENVLVGLMAGVLGTVVNSILVLLLMLAGTGDPDIAKTIFAGMVGQTAYNGLLSVPLYIWYYKLSRSGVLRLSR